MTASPAREPSTPPTAAARFDETGPAAISSDGLKGDEAPRGNAVLDAVGVGLVTKVLEPAKVVDTV